MEKSNQKLNATLSKKMLEKNGKHYVNFMACVLLENGKVVEFEFVPKFYNKKFDYLLRKNLKEQGK